MGRTTWQMQRLRDNPECADQEHQAKSNDADPGLNVKLSFDINEDWQHRILPLAHVRKLLCCVSRA
ncbi:hypothetical protein [Escherichia coli]|uniref:hypothetical protein n=1 Tax=Escherichia coli TaxID=562 RepID=UPI002021B959|nr:hypothetical protein [Escherichia coli]